MSEEQKTNEGKTAQAVDLQTYVRLHHPNCRDNRCSTCLSDHLKLGKLLDNFCKTDNRIDHLGKIHLWMSKNNQQPETEYGWATPETFDMDNINAYIEAYINGEV